MTHADSIKDIYNGLVQRYQVNHHFLVENQTPANTLLRSGEKNREAMTHKLEMMAYIAADLCEPELAGLILTAASELGSDAVFPTPM